jgi:hypothetical protein
VLRPGQWVDTDDALDYRLAYWYDFDAYARWTWLTDRQVGVSTFQVGSDKTPRLFLCVFVMMLCCSRQLDVHTDDAYVIYRVGVENPYFLVVWHPLTCRRRN